MNVAQERYFDRHADVPSTFSGGWYDPFAIGTTNYFRELMKRQNSTPQRLIMGPRQPWRNARPRSDVGGRRGLRSPRRVGATPFTTRSDCAGSIAG